MEWNRDGANYTDLYVLNYHGINVFFGVGNVHEDSICVYEIKAKKRKIHGKIVDMISKRRTPSNDPYFVPPYMNSWTQTNYTVMTFNKNDTTGFFLEVTSKSKIFLTALNLGINCPKLGWVCAEKIPNDKEYCFESIAKKKRYKIYDA